MNNLSDKIWEKQHDIVLKNWGEISACYAWMHDRAFREYKRKNIHYAIPVIILSTLTGTANFAQQNIPEHLRPMAIMVIGGLNLLSGLITTLAQFFKINELQESHRSSSVMFSKFSRNITVELNLPVNDRCSDGSVFVDTCRQEYNRMIEQSPSIPNSILILFNKKFKHSLFSKPTISQLHEIVIYKDDETSVENKHLERYKLIEQQRHKSAKNLKIKRASFKLPKALRTNTIDDSDSEELNTERSYSGDIELNVPTNVPTIVDSSSNKILKL